MSIAFFPRAIGEAPRVPAPARPMSSAASSRWLIGALPADVEELPVARIARTRAQERIRRIVHVDEIAHLRTVAVDVDRLVFDGEPDEPADEALTVVTDQLPGP